MPTPDGRSTPEQDPRLLTQRELAQLSHLEDQAWARVDDDLKQLLNIFDADDAVDSLAHFSQKPMVDYTIDEEAATRDLFKMITGLRNIRRAQTELHDIASIEEAASHRDDGSGEFPSQHL